MADEAIYHRTFLPDNSLDLSPEDLREMDPVRRRLVQHALVSNRQQHAFTVVGRGLAWLWIKPKRDQDFATYATPFEKSFSKILHRKLTRGLDPIVDSRLTVIAHVGAISGSHLWAPQGTEYRDGMMLNFTEVPIFGSADSPGEEWQSVGATEEKFHLIARVDGLVLAVMGADITGVEPTEFWLLDVLQVGNLLARFGIAAGRKIIRSLISTSSKNAIAHSLDGPTAGIAKAFLTGRNIPPLTREQVEKAIRSLRQGRNVRVRNLKQMRQIQSELGQLGVRPENTSRLIPQRPPKQGDIAGSHLDGRGTFRVDPPHGKGNSPKNPAHEDAVHINIKLPSGVKVDIAITDELQL